MKHLVITFFSAVCILLATLTSAVAAQGIAVTSAPAFSKPCQKALKPALRASNLHYSDLNTQAGANKFYSANLNNNDRLAKIFKVCRTDPAFRASTLFSKSIRCKFCSHASDCKGLICIHCKCY